MLKKMLLVVAACLLVGAVLTAHHFLTTPRQEQPSLPMTTEAALLAKEGERADLLAYEEQRLRDPTTGTIPAGMRHRELDFAKKLPKSQRGLGAADKAFTGWKIRGPHNIGGRVRALTFDITDPTYQTLLAGGVSGGMWRTTDDGDTWTRTTDPSQLQSITCVVQDTRPGHENVFYYGTGEFQTSTNVRGAILRGDGVYKSVDGGLTWQLLPATSTNIPQEADNPFDYVHNLAIDTSETTYDEVYAATYGFIYRSLDGGLTWEAVLGDPVVRADMTDVIVSPTGIVYACLSYKGGVSGIFRSPNGVDWTDITPADLVDFGRLVPVLAPSNENVLYLSNCGNSIYNFFETGFRKYTYLSGDGSGEGGVWEDRSDNLDIDGTYGSDIYNTQFGYNQCTTIGPDDPNFVILGGVDVWRSTDGFATAHQVSVVGGWVEPTHHADVHRIIFQPGSNKVVYSASDGGIHKTLDITVPNVTWKSLNNGFYTTQFYSVAVDQNLPGNPIVIGGTQDNGTLWTNNEEAKYSWTRPLDGDGGFCAVVDAAASPGEYFMAYIANAIYRCQVDSDGRKVSRTMISPHGASYSDFSFINPYIIDPVAEQIIYVATRNGVWRNDNWYEIPLGTNNPSRINWVQLTDIPVNESISALAAPLTGSRTLFYGTSMGKIYRVPNAFEAPEGTIPEELHNNAPFPERAFVNSISIHPEDCQKVLLCFSNYMVSSLWYSQDGGQSWVEVEGNLAGDDGPSVRSVKIMPFEGTDYWFIGTSIGVFSTVYSPGEPVVWELEAADLIGNAIVNDLACRSSDGLVVAATHGLGIYSVNLAGSASPEALKEQIQTDQVVLRNAPNPFNPMTTISYTLPRSERVSLRVFDVAGKLVKVLCDGLTEPAGQYAVVWDGTDGSGHQVPSGTYLYSLEAGAVHTTNKMILVR